MANRTTQVNRTLEGLFNKASEVALKEIEAIAREFLKDKPGVEFVMAMGSYFFVDEHKQVNASIICKELDSFIRLWDDSFHMTATAMRFTYDSEVVTEW